MTSALCTLSPSYSSVSDLNLALTLQVLLALPQAILMLSSCSHHISYSFSHRYSYSRSCSSYSLRHLPHSTLLEVTAHAICQSYRNYRWERQSGSIVSLSKFYSSGDPLFLGHSPSPVFTAVLEESHVRHGANRRCLQSNMPSVPMKAVYSRELLASESRTSSFARSRRTLRRILPDYFA